MEPQFVVYYLLMVLELGTRHHYIGRFCALASATRPPTRFSVSGSRVVNDPVWGVAIVRITGDAGLQYHQKVDNEYKKQSIEMKLLPEDVRCPWPYNTGCSERAGITVILSRCEALPERSFHSEL